MASKPTIPNKQPEGSRNGISNSDLLQANATVIAGVLIFLTVSSLSLGLISGPNLGAILITLAPLCASSGIIIGGKNPSVPFLRFPLTRFLSILGFWSLALLIGALAYNESNPPISFTISTPAEKCATNPQGYNITHVADCSKFFPGSLAWECALNPEKFNVTLKRCTDFIQ